MWKTSLVPYYKFMLSKMQFTGRGDLWLKCEKPILYNCCKIQMLSFHHCLGCCDSSHYFIHCFRTLRPWYFPTLFRKMCSVHAHISILVIYSETVLTHTLCTSLVMFPHPVMLVILCLTMCNKINPVMLTYVLNPASISPCRDFNCSIVHVRITIIKNVWVAWLWNVSQLNVWTHAFCTVFVHWEALQNIILKYK